MPLRQAFLADRSQDQPHPPQALLVSQGDDPVAVSTYVDGFGTGIVGIDLQLPNKKAEAVIKMMGFKNFMVC